MNTYMNNLQKRASSIAAALSKITNGEDLTRADYLEQKRREGKIASFKYDMLLKEAAKKEQDDKLIAAATKYIKSHPEKGGLRVGSDAKRIALAKDKIVNKDARAAKKAKDIADFKKKYVAGARDPKTGLARMVRRKVAASGIDSLLKQAGLLGDPRRSLDRAWVDYTQGLGTGGMMLTHPITGPTVIANVLKNLRIEDLTEPRILAYLAGVATPAAAAGYGAYKGGEALLNSDFVQDKLAANVLDMLRKQAEGEVLPVEEPVVETQEMVTVPKADMIKLLRTLSNLSAGRQYKQTGPQDGSGPGVYAAEKAAANTLDMLRKEAEKNAFTDAYNDFMGSDFVDTIKDKYSKYGEEIGKDALAGSLIGAGVGGLNSLLSGNGTLLGGVANGALAGGTGGAILGGLYAAKDDPTVTDFRNKLAGMISTK